MQTLSELRKFLLETISDIKTGKCDVQKANAICSTANSVISLTRLEMDYFEKSEFQNEFIGESESDIEVNSDLEKTLKEIEDKRKMPVVFNQK